MKNMFAPWSGLMVLVVGWFCIPALSADFNLVVDNGSLRRVNNYAEIDIILERTGGGPPPTIYSLLLNLQLFPVAGQPHSSIDGVSFLGLRNADGQNLFPDPEVSYDTAHPHIMPGSLINVISNHVEVPATSTTAFTVQVVNYNSIDVEVELGFFPVGNFYQRTRIEDPVLRQFNSLVRSAALSVQPIPEPGSWLLAGLGLLAGGITRWRVRAVTGYSIALLRARVRAVSPACRR